MPCNEAFKNLNFEITNELALLGLESGLCIDPSTARTQGNAMLGFVEVVHFKWQDCADRTDGDKPVCMPQE